MKPFTGRVLIEPFPSDSIFEQSEVKYQTIGRVTAVGAEVDSLKVGDIVAYTPFGVDLVKYKDKEYFVLEVLPEFILGTFDELPTE